VAEIKFALKSKDLVDVGWGEVNIVAVATWSSAASLGDTGARFRAAELTALAD